jgi:predicted DCC family thiol-disulfide oxidoreductase YuxK
MGSSRVTRRRLLYTARVMATDHILLYDADCGFCRWSLDKFLARDTNHRIRPMPLHSPEADALLPGMDEQAKMASWHLVLPDGTVRSAGDAVAPLLRLLQKGRPLASIAGTVPGLTRATYRLVARNREKFGRMLGAQACAVDPSARSETKHS